MTLSKGFLFTLTAAFCWAIVILLTRFMLAGGTEPMALFFWLAVCELPFWIVLGWKHKKQLGNLTRHDLLIFGAMVLFSTIGANLSEFFALANSPAINYSFLIRTTILFTILFAWLFLKEPLTKKKVVIAIIILIGSYFLTTNGRVLVLSKGDIFTVLEAALLAFGNNVLGKMATSRMSALVSATVSQLLGFLGILIVTAAVRSPLVFAAPIWLLVVCAATAVVLTLCRFKAYSYYPVSFVTMVFSFTPVFVTILAVPFLKETLTPFQLVGGVLIIAGGIAVEKLKL